MQLVKVNLKKLKQAKYNPRKKLKPSDKEYQQLKKSIENLGYSEPIIVNKDYTVIGGHQRLNVLKDLGYTEIDVIQLDLSKDKEKALNLALNKITGKWDDDLLVELLSDLSDVGFDLEITGFDLAELDDLFKDSLKDNIKEDDFDEEPPEEPISRRGDIWLLGKHRLMCGDSTKEEDVAKLMNGVKADMVFTDPPYGVSYTGGMKIENGKIESNSKRQIKNDALDYKNLYKFLYDVFINLKNNTILKSAFYVFYAHSRTREFLNAFYDAGLKQRSIIIWYKTSGGFGDFMAQYMNAYEPCIYGSNGESVNWYGPTNEKTIWEIDKEKKCDLHPTMKPIELVARAINNSSKKDDSILDLFGGSGSTLIACEQLDRICYMMELDEKYTDVIVKRYIEQVGSDQDVYLIRNGKKTKYANISKD